MMLKNQKSMLEPGNPQKTKMVQFLVYLIFIIKFVNLFKTDIVFLNLNSNCRSISSHNKSTHNKQDEKQEESWRARSLFDIQTQSYIHDINVLHRQEHLHYYTPNLTQKPSEKTILSCARWGVSGAL